MRQRYALCWGTLKPAYDKTHDPQAPLQSDAALWGSATGIPWITSRFARLLNGCKAAWDQVTTAGMEP
jgi:hypothetical protein